MMAEEKKKEKVQRMELSVEMELIDHFQFLVKFDIPEMPDMYTDEPATMGGENKGPNPARMVAAAVANCMASSLVHCLRRARADVKGMTATSHGIIERNDEGLLRLQSVDVTIRPKFGSRDDEKLLERCRDMFEKYCIVTQSIRDGMPVSVSVEPEYDD